MISKIIGFLNSYSTGTSGGDVRFVEIMKYLPIQEKCVITSKLGEEFCRGRELNADFIETSDESKFNFRNIVFLYLKRLFKALVSCVRGDIFYIGSDILPDVLPAFIYKLFRKKILWIQMIFHLIPDPLTRHGRYSINNVLSFMGQRFTLLLIRVRADKIIVINQSVKDALVRYGIPKGRIFIGMMGIDKEFLNKLVPVVEDRYEGVYIGRIHPSKGIFDTIDIWNEVCKSYPLARLAIIGDGNDTIKNRLLCKIKEVSLENNVSLLGHLNDIVAYSILKQAKIFLFPSYEEGWGLAIAEAMSCGIPVVAYDLDIYKEIFPKGLLRIPIGNKNEFAKAIVELFNNEKKLEILSQEGLEHSYNYTWDYASKKEWEIINEGKK